MSNLGLNKKVQQKYAKKTVEGEAEGFAYQDLKDELKLLNEAHKNILKIIYNKQSDDEKDKVNSFEDLLKVDTISDNDKCMTDLIRVFNEFGFEPNCNSFKDFINKQKEISDSIEKIQ